MLRRGSLLSRTAALGLLAAVAIGGYVLVVGPVLDAFRANAEAIERSEDLLQRQQALAAQRPQLVARLAEEEQRAATLTGYLEGPSDALAAARLQDRVRTLVEAAGGELRSTQILPAEAVEASPGTRRATLRVQLVVAIDGLAAILHGLETGQPYVLIDELTIRSQGARRRQEPDGAPVLDVSLQLSGFVRSAAT
ncbi:MAG: type II secretion system protein GspM [Geminicoccales bacterium]